jgi:hypothetical protein
MTIKRPGLYVGLILTTALVACVYQFHRTSIFACHANSYTADRYIAYCGGTQYFDYEHGAFAFGLEPSIQQFVKEADVLFLGNSKAQIAFSTSATEHFFRSISTHFYLLAMAYGENQTFVAELLRRIEPRAKVLVINVDDDFFSRFENTIAASILHDPEESRHRYEVKRHWQLVHELICGRLPLLCGHKFVVYRSRETGAYTEWTLERQTKTGVSYDMAINRPVVDRSVPIALDFLSRFAQGRCVILTTVPTVGTKIGDAKAIADALQMNLIAPGDMTGLTTFDEHHLDKLSAERWSQAFFEVASPNIRSCLANQAPNVVSTLRPPPKPSINDQPPLQQNTSTQRYWH